MGRRRSPVVPSRAVASKPYVAVAVAVAAVAARGGGHRGGAAHLILLRRFRFAECIFLFLDDQYPKAARRRRRRVITGQEASVSTCDDPRPPHGCGGDKADVFLPAARAYGMTTMFGILPPVMALSMRAQMAEREARSRARYAAGAAGTEAKEAKEEHGVMDGADERWYDVLLSRLGLGKKDIIGDIGDIGDLKLGWLSVPTPRMMSTGVPGGPPALAALSFSAFAITLGQLRNDLNKGFDRRWRTRCWGAAGAMDAGRQSAQSAGEPGWSPSTRWASRPRVPWGIRC